MYTLTGNEKWGEAWTGNDLPRSETSSAKCIWLKREEREREGNMYENKLPNYFVFAKKKSGGGREDFVYTKQRSEGK